MTKVFAFLITLLVAAIAIAADPAIVPTPSVEATSPTIKLHKVGAVVPTPHKDNGVPTDLEAAIIAVQQDRVSLDSANQSLVSAKQALIDAQNNVTTKTAMLAKDAAALDVIYHNFNPPVPTPNDTTTSLTTTPNPAAVGQAIQVQATVSGGLNPPMGSAVLAVDGSTMTTIPIVNGSGSTSIASLLAGTHTLDLVFASSDSSKWSNSSGTTTTVVTAPVSGPVSVLFYYDPSQWNDTTTQGAIRSDLTLRTYLNQHCTIDEAGVPAYRWVPVQDDGSKLPKSISAILTALRAQTPAITPPWWVVTNNAGTIQINEAMSPDVTALMAKLKTIGGQ